MRQERTIQATIFEVFVAAKKRARAIEYSRGQDKKRRLCRELIAAGEARRDELQAMATGLAEAAEIAT